MIAYSLVGLLLLRFHPLDEEMDVTVCDKNPIYFQFTLQVAEKQVNYRTQLLHTHSALESNTNFKVQYNDRMPFVAGLQWKDTSKNDLYKWEGKVERYSLFIFLDNVSGKHLYDTKEL